MLKKAILWKEWVSTRTTLAGLLGLLLMVYPVSIHLGVPGSLRLVQNTAPLVAAGIGFILAITALAGERKHNTIDFLLSLPFSRRELFINKITFHLTSLVMIMALNYGALLAVWNFNANVKDALEIYLIHNLFFVFTVAAIFTFAFTLIFTTIAGSRMAAGVFTGIFYILPMGFVGLLALTVWPYWPEINEHTNKFLRWGFRFSPIEIISPTIILSNWPWILAASAVLVLGSSLLFVRNPVEKNGHVVVFTALEPVLKVGVSICSALLLGAFAAINPILHAFFALLGGVGGWVIVTWLIRRSRGQA